MKQLEKLLIRADACMVSGTGHVMRMIALAQAYLRRGGSVMMLSINCPDSIVERMRTCGMSHDFIKASRAGALDDAHLTIEFAQKIGAEWLVVDGYHFDYNYQKHVKGVGLSLLCVDDHNYSGRWCCDAVLNQNLDSEKMIHYVNDQEGAHVMAGANFCLLREEFLKKVPSKPCWNQIDNVLVTLGGADSNNVTKKVLSILNQYLKRFLNIRVLCGASNVHYDDLCSFKTHHNVIVMRGTTDMVQQYEWADGVISAGGSTCWEWLYYGLPAAIVKLAKNQLPIIQALTNKRKVALSLGDLMDYDANIISDVQSWLNAPDSILDGELTKTLIDGYGAERVASFIVGRALYYRPIVPNDFKIILRLMNEFEARSVSFSQHQISMDEHLSWINAKLADSKFWHRVIEIVKNDQFVGLVRIERLSNSEYPNISINIFPEFRNKNYGSQIIHTCSEMYCIEREEKVIEAHIKCSNERSIRAFIKAGYLESKDANNDCSDCIILRYKHEFELNGR